MAEDNTWVKEILASQLNQKVLKSPSPAMIWLEPIVREVTESSLTFEYQVSMKMTNVAGMLHGGIIALMMDDLIGATLISSGRPNLYTTINNVIDYFLPANLQDVLIAKTTIIKSGRQIINMQFELYLKDSSKLIARGYSNVMETKFPVAEFVNARLQELTNLR